MSESSVRLSSGGSDGEYVRSPDTATRKRSRSVSTKRSRSRSAAPPAKRRAVRGVKKAYIELLNQCVQDTAGEDDDSVPLPASQIGASFWTSAEKSAFFNTLQRVGPDNLPALTSAVQTKSQLEIYTYVRLLQAGVDEAESTLAEKESFTSGDVPAANEISPSCEYALEGIADSLAFKVDAKEQQLLRDKYGEDWLIDETTAERLEEDYGQPLEDEDDEIVSRASTGFPSAELLRPTAFLRLSDAIFMNGPPGTGSNWIDHDPGKGPAMYRDALEDFYSLAVSMTKRLVQVTLFQAMSRIRAMNADRSHPYTPQLRVTNVDVWTAREMMGMKVDQKTYWAKLARNFDLEVYSDSKKYSDGRSGTKNGYKLSHDEVEAELDLLPIPLEEKDLSDCGLYSDDLTDSENDDDFDETAYLELIDERQSREEERRLWYLAERCVRPSPEEQKISPQPHIEKEARIPPWRDRLRYVPEWSTLDRSIDEAEFQETQLHGQRKRKTRETLQEQHMQMHAMEEKPQMHIKGEKVCDSEEEDLDEEPGLPRKHDDEQ